MATPRAVPKRSGSSRGKWFFTGITQIHETIPWWILGPFNNVFDVRHTSLSRGSNAQAEQLDVALRRAPLGSSHLAFYQRSLLRIRSDDPAAPVLAGFGLVIAGDHHGPIGALAA